VPASKALPLLVLLHGLGETDDESRGIHAWANLYGLLDAYERLPLAVSDLAIVCPFTPNPFKREHSGGLLDGYADYLERKLLPAVRAATPIRDGAASLGIDGVSLGGYVSIELFLRKPELFGVVGSLQGAFGVTLAEYYAKRVAEAVSKVGPRSIHVATSTNDPFRAAAERLAARLAERAVPATLSVLPGPHDQVFLREFGAFSTLCYQATALCNPG